MTDLQFADEVLDRLQERYPRFHARSYVFVLQVLHHVIQSLDEPRHVSGQELAEGVRELALDRFGPMARTVLEHWGIHDTEDVGRVVFAMVEQGILIKQDGDQPEDFSDVFDFEEAFERNYPWDAQP
ncbi:MAG TPA: Minf_1886 family protein [Longimicrobiales bacterium]|nr:Minf_1886 family protein [Longimicrobiales bacterium]